MIGTGLGWRARGAVLVASSAFGLVAAGPALASTPGTLSIVAGVPGISGAPTAGPATSSHMSDPIVPAYDPTTGALYIADYGNNDVEEVSSSGTLLILAGNGTMGAPTPGPATSSAVSGPQGVAVDPSTGNVYIAAGSDVLKVTPSGTLSVVAGNGTSGAPTPGPATSSALRGPEGLAFDSATGALYIADTSGNEILEVSSSGTLSIVAGTGTLGLPTPGPATSSELAMPSDVAVDSTTGALYIDDTINNVVEKVSSSGTLSVVAGDGNYGVSTPGPATSSHLNTPAGVAVDPTTGTVFISEYQNHVVDEISPSGMLSIIAGTGTAGVPTPGPATSSHLDMPNGLAYDPATAHLYLADAGNDAIEQIALSVAPVNTAAPVISGTAQVGQSLSASEGSWAPTPTSYGYQWQDCDSSGANCTAIPGATQSSYTVGTGDGSHTLEVAVTATNAAGSQTSTSAPTALVAAPATTTTGTTTTPTTTACSASATRVSRRAIGSLRLGMARAKVKSLSSGGTESACLSGGAVQVAYPSAAVLSHLPAAERARFRGRVVFILSTSSHTQVSGVHTGMSVRAVTRHRRLRRRVVIRVGHVRWYFVRRAHATDVLRVVHGKVRAIGLASLAVTRTRAQDRALLRSL